MSESKLKTLKDLTDVIDNWDTRYHVPSHGEITAPENSLFIWSDDLRQEAIRWLKELRKERSVFDPFNITSFSEREKFVIVTWIKHFFNITEEDLNE